MNKKYSILRIYLFLLSLLPCTTYGQIPVAFDECTDLMSLIWRFAGAKEYSQCTITPYVESIDAHFANFKNHRVVQLAQQYRNEHGVGYDAVPSYATHIQVNKDGKLVMNDKLINHIDQRWTTEMQKEFLFALNDFYAKSHFHDWFISTESMQKECLEAFAKISNMVDLEWYGNFFNKSEANFRIILCPLACVNNYGMDCFLKDGSHQLCPVISCASYINGKVTYSSSVLSIVIHEFCHAYCNPLIDKYWDQMSENAWTIYGMNKDILASQAYTNAHILMYESLVRASVIKYFKEHFTPQQVNFEQLIVEEESKGFLLTRTLLKAFENRNETVYTDMEAYMPTIVKVVNDFTIEQFNKEKEESDIKKIHYTMNIKNGADDVPPGDFILNITFDQPIVGNPISINMIDRDFPEFKGYSWSNDHLTLTVKFKMEANHEYGFEINGSSYMSADGNVAVNTVLRFKTKE